MIWWKTTYFLFEIKDIDEFKNEFYYIVIIQIFHIQSA